MIRQAGMVAQRAFGIALLPLSLLPIFLLTPQIVRAPELYMRRHVLPALVGPVPASRAAQPVPRAHLTPAQKRRFVPFPTHETIPVLAYHGVDDHRADSVSARNLALQLQMLARAGFTAISLPQYVRFLYGERRGLPGRPVLLTFDDARIETWRAVDRMLALYRMRATMFVLPGETQHANPTYMSWREIKAAASTGRWEFGQRAMPENVVTSRDERRDHYLLNRRFAQGHLESFHGWRRRVTEEVGGDRETMAANMGYRYPLAFLLPGVPVSPERANDERIPRALPRMLARLYGGVFVEQTPFYVRAGHGDNRVGRFEVTRNTTAGGLYAQLRQAAPGAPR